MASYVLVALSFVAAAHGMTTMRPHMHQSSHMPHMHQSTHMPHMHQSTHMPHNMHQSSHMPHMHQSTQMPHNMHHSTHMPHNTPVMNQLLFKFDHKNQAMLVKDHHICFLYMPTSDETMNMNDQHAFVTLEMKLLKLIDSGSYEKFTADEMINVHFSHLPLACQTSLMKLHE